MSLNLNSASLRATKRSSIEVALKASSTPQAATMKHVSMAQSKMGLGFSSASSQKFPPVKRHHLQSTSRNTPKHGVSKASLNGGQQPNQQLTHQSTISEARKSHQQTQLSSKDRSLYYQESKHSTIMTEGRDHHHH